MSYKRFVKYESRILSFPCTSSLRKLISSVELLSSTRTVQLCVHDPARLIWHSRFVICQISSSWSIESISSNENFSSALTLRVTQTQTQQQQAHTVDRFPNLESWPHGLNLAEQKVNCAWNWKERCVGRSPMSLEVSFRKRTIALSRKIPTRSQTRCLNIINAHAIGVKKVVDCPSRLVRQKSCSVDEKSSFEVELPVWRRNCWYT